jgi:GNAT superfamily N-acetyltransferase
MIMDVSRPTARLEDVARPPAPLRAAYLRSLGEPQELYVESLVQTGRTVLIRDDDDQVIGYAVLAEATIVEFFVIPDALSVLPSAFAATREQTHAERALCKTFDHLMITAAASTPARTRTTGHLFRIVRDPGFATDPAVAHRIGRSSDADAIWSIHDGFFDDLDEVERYLAEGTLHLYETAGGELLGCGIRTRVIPGDDAVDIGMVVARSHRRRGLGGYIVSHLKRHCLDAGDRPIAGCSTDNLASRRALENAGLATTHSLVDFAY